MISHHINCYNTRYTRYARRAPNTDSPSFQLQTRDLSMKLPPSLDNTAEDDGPADPDAPVGPVCDCTEVEAEPEVGNVVGGRLFVASPLALLLFPEFVPLRAHSIDASVSAVASISPTPIRGPLNLRLTRFLSSGVMGPTTRSSPTLSQRRTSNALPVMVTSRV